MTLLFADIVNFNKFSAAVTPETAISALNIVFTEFDKICLAFGLYKVYTIGDCYVVMSINEGGKLKSVSNEIKSVLSMGFEMIDIMKMIREQFNFNGLDMRIGVHTGNVIGGIIGTNIIRYDIFGKSVMIANKMKTNAKLGKINVSEVTKKLIETNAEAFNEEYEFEEMPEIYVKSMEQNIRNFLVKKPNKI